MSDRKATLKASGLTKQYGDRRVVDNVDLQLAPGQITALVGPSGSGKTTLLRLFAGMEKPSAGSISSGAIELSGTRKFVNVEDRKIGLIFQDFALFPHLSVADNIAFGLRHLTPHQRTKVVETWADQLNLSTRINAFPHQLSGGEQQRVAIARALAAEPVAILMDEPFSGLDFQLKDQARDAAIGAIRQAGIPALFVTHDPTEALEFADMIAVMGDGRILQAGTPEIVYSQPIDLRVARALGSVQKIGYSDLPDAWRHAFKPNCDIFVRPEALDIDASSSVVAELVTCRSLAHRQIVKLKLGEQILRADLHSHEALHPGQLVPLSLDTAAAFQFHGEVS